MLYASSARIGGTGLDTVVHQTLIGLYNANILRKAMAFDNCQTDVPASFTRILRWHPVRMLSVLDREYYYGAKKHALDRAAARELRRHRYGLFHGWSGECLHTLRAARRLGIPNVIEIPTWHRNKGERKRRATASERAKFSESLPRRMMHSLLVSRQQVMEEYDLADLLLVLSEFAEQTFRAAGIPQHKLFRTSRGVDPERFAPAGPPPKFRALFAGALIKRKGVHHLLEAWHKLDLKDAELYLLGTVHPEMEPYLAQFASPSIKALGFSSRTEEFFVKLRSTFFLQLVKEAPR